MINRSNYEIWFIDFLDGKLSSEQEMELRVFLSHNSDLRKELDEMSVDMPIVFEEISTPRTHLKKQIKTVGNLREDNYEEAFIARREGDLDTIQNKDLDEFLLHNAFLIAELNYFEKITITHNNEVFPNKNRLKHSAVIIPIFRFAAAASVLIFIGIGAVKYLSKENSDFYALAYQKVEISTPQIEILESTTIENYQPSTEKLSNNRTENIASTSRTKLNMAEVESMAISNIEKSSFDGNIVVAAPKFAVIENSEIENETLSWTQVFGKMVEGSAGENSFSEDLKDDKKLSTGDMIALAAVPFKKSKNPVLSTSENDASGRRRIKFNLGVFEADFALK